MKSQYFGDSRDAFKYDLWLELAGQVSGIRKLTFIPMLTPDDGTSQGRHRSYGNVLRPDLLEFLKSQSRVGGKSLLALRQFMLTTGVVYNAHCESDLFVHEARGTYFANIGSELLRDAAVLVDPDVGLEPASAAYMRREGPAKYLLFKEVQALLERTSGATFLLIYQHLQRHAGRVPQDVQRKAMKVASLTPTASCVFVRNHDVAFLVVSSNADSSNSLKALCETYARRLGLEHGAVALPPISGGQVPS